MKNRIERVRPKTSGRGDDREQGKKRFRPRDFGPPPLLAGDDPKAYNAILKDIAEDMQPSGSIERMFVRDVAYSDFTLTWLRRLRAAFLNDEVRRVVHYFFKGVENHERKEAAEGDDLKDLDGAAKGLTASWLQGDPLVMASLDLLLAQGGVTRDTLLVTPLKKNIVLLNEIDLMITRMVTNRNAMVREFWRNRAMKALWSRPSSKQTPGPEHKVLESRRVHRDHAA
jgi:hypothetical protein